MRLNTVPELYSSQKTFYSNINENQAIRTLKIEDNGNREADGKVMNTKVVTQINNYKVFENGKVVAQLGK